MTVSMTSMMSSFLPPSASDILCAGFSVSGSGCLSGLSQPRYLEFFCPVYPWPFLNQAYRALPGRMPRVLVFFPFPA
jgi:hypothetical protein